jgi:hypothetical protein
MLNFGHVEVFSPSRANLAPTKEAMLSNCDREDAPRGWVTISKDLSKKPDTLFLVLARELTKAGEQTYVLLHSKVPSALSKELREYLKTRPPSVKWLFTQGTNKDVSQAEPYKGVIGRASMQARINRVLKSHGLGSYLGFRLAIMQHHAEEARKELS